MTSILTQTEKLIAMYRRGELGGEVLPEDANPGFPKNSRENYLYFTLPMALNYQRNSYALWESALKTWNDEENRFVFEPKACLAHSFAEVQAALVKHKVALQKQRQTEIWLTLCETFVRYFDGDVRKLLDEMDNDVDRIRDYIQKEHKKEFPYLSGIKLCNYWLYVLHRFADREYRDMKRLTVAADTHACKASLRLGLITEEEFASSKVREIVTRRWMELLEPTPYRSIDLNDPLWLWSRNGFPEIK